MSKLEQTKQRFLGTLKGKILAVVLGSSFAALGFALVAFWWTESSLYRDLLRQRIVAHSHTLGMNSRAALAFEDHEAAQRLISSLSVLNEVDFAQLVSKSGKVIGTFSRDKTPTIARPAPQEELVSWESDSLNVWSSIYLENEKVGAVFIRATLSELSAQRMRFLEICAAVLLLSLVVALLASSFFQSIITAPLLHLLQMVRHVTIHKDYSVRVPTRTTGELGDLCSGFNEMLAELSTRETQLVSEKRRAESADKIKSEFLANMSHEIRTPLNGVIGMTELVLDSEINAEQRECLELSHASAHSLLCIINDILDFSKVEAGKLDITPEPFTLRTFIARLTTMFDLRCQEKNISVSYSVSNDTPEFLVADSGRIGQVLINLVYNAIKFTDEGGKVELDVSVKDIDGDEATLCFEVRDTGIGIPKEMLGIIFEPFRQVDGSYSRVRGGTGLGLAIASKLASLMGGTLTVESEEGRGSIFRFNVHVGVTDKLLTSPNDSKSASSTIAFSPSGQHRILVVEDHKVSQLTVKRCLERAGHKIFTADNGREALELLSRLDFDLVLMDCQMPVLDGFETSRHIRENELGGKKHLPIIALTAFAMKGDRERCFDAGMDEYLSKPVSLASLVSTVEKTLRKFYGENAIRSMKSIT